MCSYIVEKAALVGSAKGRKGWMRIDTANVYFDHPYHSTLDHVLAIDFTNEGEGGRDRVAVELSADFGARTGRPDSGCAGERRGCSRDSRAGCRHRGGVNSGRRLASSGWRHALFLACHSRCVRGRFRARTA